MRVSHAIVTAGLTATLTMGCDVTGPATGAVRITVATSGVDLDADGYSVRVDSGAAHPAALNGTLIIAGVATGQRVVRLQSLAPNCQRTDNFATHSVNVIAGDTVDTAFDVSCTPDVGIVRVFVTTRGGDRDPDGYILTLDGTLDQSVDHSATVYMQSVRVGVHTLTLSGLAENCHHVGPNAITVTVVFGEIVNTAFELECMAFTGKMRVVTTTAGVSMDPDGYEVLVDDAEVVSPIGVNGDVTIEELLVGNRSVELKGVAPNCTVSGSNPRTVSVAAKATSEVVFSLTCAAPASAQVRAVTTGVDPDPNGYAVSVAGSGFAFSTNLGINGMAPVTGMGAGDHTVTLSELAVNCDVSGSNPRTVAMVSGATTEVTFDVACAPVTQLAFWRQIGGSAEIHVVNSNGSGLTRLTTSIASDVEPSWSPDGSKIVFRSERDGNAEIYRMNADGTEPVRLTSSGALDYDPAWSPDGAKIAFVSSRDNGNHEIYVMNADGTNPVRLTNHSSNDLEPAWSPDGTKIVFRREGNGSSSIYVMNVDGTDVTRVSTGGADIQPDWSPDGSKIAFARQIACDYYYSCFHNIFVMNADGSNVKRLESSTHDSQPTWSPDGRWIAVASYQCDYYNCSYTALVAIKSDGKSRTEILPIDAGNPSWRR